jgi:DNA replication and repair protein RecF
MLSILEMLEEIKITNYRNIENVETSLSEGINLIVAKNGSGKSNFLESIYYTIFRNSFRPLNTYAEIIKLGSDFAKVETKWDQLHNIELIISNTNNRLTRKVKLNDKQLGLKKAVSMFPVLIFAPHSVDLSNGAPSVRRRDLDDILTLLDPKYVDLLSRYNQVHKNRNALIKAIRDGNSTRNELAFWTSELSRLSAQIFVIRSGFFEDIKPFIQEAFSEIYHDIKEFEVVYNPNLKIEGNAEHEFRKKYEENMEKEIIVGKTLYGIHKDDYSFSFDGNKVLKYHGSRGQQRIGSFIFKIAQLKMLKNNTDSDVLLLIDDLMSELDDLHRKNLGEYLINLETQIILTGADIKEIPKHIIESCKRIEL